MYGKGKRPAGSCKVMTNGDWELFPESVEYKAYSIRRQPAVSRWKNYFEKRLKKRSVNSPVVIKESYTFDWDDVKTELVTASNVIVSEDMELKISDGKNRESTLPSNSHAAAYTISTLFRNGKAVLDVFSDVQMVQASKKAFGETGSGISFCLPPKGAEYQDYIQLVQFGNSKEWKKFRCFFQMNGESVMREYRYFPKYMVCDLDGDGKAELAAYQDGSSSLWQWMAVYRLTDGVPEKNFVMKP